MSELRGVPYLAARIARLALALDTMTIQLEALEITESDAMMLESPAHHMRASVDSIEEVLARAHRIDRST